MAIEDACIAERPGRTRGRPKVLSDEARCDGLIDLALGIFSEIGYERTTMDLVASRARISKQTLYRLFPGKPSLFAAVVDRHRQSMLALPGDYDGVPLADAIAAIFHSDLDMEVYHRSMMLIETTLSEATRYPEILETLHNHGATPARADLSAWLRHEMDRGRIAPSDDAELLADILVHMMFGVSKIRNPKCAANWPGLPDRATMVRRCIDVFLHGVVR